MTVPGVIVVTHHHFRSPVLPFANRNRYDILLVTKHGDVTRGVGRHGLSVGHAARIEIVERLRGQLTQRGSHREQRERLRVQRVHGDRAVHRESPASEAPQRGEMRGAAGRLPKIAGERADVGAAAAANLGLQLRSVPAEYAPLMDANADRFQGNRLPTAGRLVGAHAADALGGERRWPLEQMAGERGDAVLDRLAWRERGLFDDFAFTVVRARARAETDARAVDLGLAIEKGEQSRRAIHEQNQQSGREGIERSAVTNASRPHGAARMVDHRMRRHARGLVDEKNAVSRGVCHRPSSHAPEPAATRCERRAPRSRPA